jgi:DamX protein
MDTEYMAALDDADDQENESKNNTPFFAPPSLSESQLKQLEMLQHLSLYSELLILVCADKGMGKTFIANALLASRETPDQSLMLEGDFSLTYLDVLHNFAQFLDLADLADDIESIEQQVIARCLQVTEEEQGSVLLIVDQAEQLPDEVLEDINQLALLAPNALHIMLLGPKGFDGKLLALAEPQAPFHMMDIEPLSDDEADVILLEQFPGQEWEAEQADFIIKQSAGSPGKILHLAQQLLTKTEPLPEASKFPVTHFAAIVLVALVLIGAYFYQNSTSSNTTSPVVEALPIEAIQAESSEVGGSALTPAGSTINSTLEDTASVGDVAPISEVNQAEVESSEDEVDFNFPASDIAGAKSASLESAAVTEALSSSEPLVAKVTAPQVPKVSYSADEQQLMSAPSSAFVIQLFGSFNVKNSKTFQNAHETDGTRLLQYEGEYQNKPWHVVIAGPFNSKPLALEASKKLSSRLRDQKPWVRSISDIQTVLRNRK